MCRITDVKYNSPAHNSGKVEDGDEIIQINYQTVVGWQCKKVLLQLQESTTDVLLTLKKRPKHSNHRVYGQLSLIKLPSKKRSFRSLWDNLPSPRVELINIPDSLIACTKKNKEIVSEAEELSENENNSLTPIKINNELRLYLPKPATTTLQRRHTICGNDLVNFQNIGKFMLWHQRKNTVEESESTNLRDKSISVCILLTNS